MVEIDEALGQQPCVFPAVGALVRVTVDKDVVAPNELGALRPKLGILGDFTFFTHEQEYRKTGINFILVAPDASSPANWFQRNNGFEFSSS